MPKGDTLVSLDGRQLELSNLNKVLFPAAGFTKGQLIEYYVTVGPIMLTHIADRPLTMKRFPDGVDKKYFYNKHTPVHAPEWVRTVSVPSSDGEDAVEYPLIDDLPSLAWVANLASIEIHVPLWRVGRRRKYPAPPDLMVFDLDPGEGASIVECCHVAQLVRELLADRDTDCYPKTSGSKGLQVYAKLEGGTTTWDTLREETHDIAESLERAHPDAIVSNMRKSLRTGRVLIDWSQNHPSKTTVAAYSVHGREQPTVSTPVTWDEVQACADDEDPTQLEFTTADVMQRVIDVGDLFEGVAWSTAKSAKTSTDEALKTYRSMRDPERTPEPMGTEDKPPRATKRVAKAKAVPATRTAKAAPKAGTKSNDLPRFVVQEHHASALHWDFRLERDGVLVSWALPKGVPMDPKKNHLAVHTEDHPMDYETFEGEIPKGEYGGGHVSIWDRGTYEVEKWQDKEVMVQLHGERVTGRYVLFPTNAKNWMIHRMDPAPEGFTPLPQQIKPMLATPAQLPTTDKGWAYEIKWDGYHAIAFVDGGRIRLQSRNHNEFTESFPEFRSIGLLLGARQTVLDGEIVVMGDDGLPNFGLLQHRVHKANAATKKEADEHPATYVVFDVLHLDGEDLLAKTYDERRALLEGLDLNGEHVTTAASYRDVKGKDILKGTADSGLEGIIAKRRNSKYAPGSRSDAWIKIKNVRTQEVVIGGWTEGSGNHAGDLGALLLGVPDGTGLRFVGKVGTGFNARDRRQLLDLFAASATTKSPFRPAASVAEPNPHHFVKPVHVGEVQFGHWTDDGRLRHPTWRGLRPDKSPRDVVVEE